jgi:protein-tyrosine kinase
VTKIYEALQHAKVEVLVGPPERSRSRSGADLPSSNTHEPVLENEIRVYQNLAAVVSESPKKIIQFIGSREGEGTSTVAREFARATASKFGKLVLLLDADRYHPTQDRFFNIQPECGWQEVVRDNGPLDKVLFQVGETGLFISPSSRNGPPDGQIFNSLLLDAFFKKLKQRFDLILVDSPPAITSTDGLAISSRVDGIVLVVEAERTRWPVAETVRDRIKRNGGNILGIVLNKRRYYIPGWIYKKL